jgi:D-serine deaminase-like pyridoxal phosphate-dependent protein
MMNASEIETPAAVVDLSRLEFNIKRLQNYLDEHGIANRPHIKTHKIPEIAHMQLAQGASGITCQKLGEAEVMVQAGIRDILVPYNILGAKKLNRLVLLAKRARITLTADSSVTVSGLSPAAHENGISIPVMVEFDTGLHRCGVETPQLAAELAGLIDSAPGLQFAGLMTYPVNENTGPFVEEVKKLIEPKGLQVASISVGGTRCMWEAHQHPEITEYRAGMYVYGDRSTVELGAMTLEECSFSIRSTVVSRPSQERGILDAGSKSLSSDLLGLEGYGLILEYPEAQIYALSEEHGHVEFSGCDSKPEIGEVVTILPNHCCVANNLFNQVIGVRDGQVEVAWPVQARGAVR